MTLASSIGSGFGSPMRLAVWEGEKRIKTPFPHAYKLRNVSRDNSD